MQQLASYDSVNISIYIHVFIDLMQAIHVDYIWTEFEPIQALVLQVIKWYSRDKALLGVVFVKTNSEF